MLNHILTLTHMKLISNWRYWFHQKRVFAQNIYVLQAIYDELMPVAIIWNFFLIGDYLAEKKEKYLIPCIMNRFITELYTMWIASGMRLLQVAFKSNIHVDNTRKQSINAKF